MSVTATLSRYCATLKSDDLPPRLVERVRAFLAAHGDSRFDLIEESGCFHPVNNRAGWRDKDTFFISGDAWKEIHRGADPKRAAIYLFETGYLKVQEKGRYTWRLSTSVKGRPRTYAVRAEIMGAGGG